MKRKVEFRYDEITRKSAMLQSIADFLVIMGRTLIRRKRVQEFCLA